MAEVTTNECDVFKTRGERVKIYRVCVLEEGEFDSPCIEYNDVYLSPRAFGRLGKFIFRGVNPPGTKPDDGKVTTEIPNDEAKT